MESNKRYIDLVKDDLRQSKRLIACTAFILFIFVPVVEILSEGHKTIESILYGIANLVPSRFDVRGLMFLVMRLLVITYGYLTVIAGLNSKSETSQKLFLVHYVSGFIILFVQYTMFFIASLIINIKLAPGEMEITEQLMRAVTGYLAEFSFLLWFYAIAGFAVVITGKLLPALLGVFLCCYYTPLMFCLFYRLRCEFTITEYIGFVPLKFRWILAFFFSPIQLHQYAEYVYRDGVSLNVWGINYSLNNWHFIGIAAGMGVIVSFLTFWLYRKHVLSLLSDCNKTGTKGETQSLVFMLGQVVIRFPIVIGCGLCGGLVGWLRWGGVTGALLLLLSVAMISNLVVDIVWNINFKSKAPYNVGLKQLCSHPFQIVSSIITTMFVFCCFRYDLLGFDRYYPDTSTIRSVSIALPYIGDVPDEVTLTYLELEDMEPILDIAAIGIEEAVNVRTKMSGSGYRPEIISISMNSDDYSIACEKIADPDYLIGSSLFSQYGEPYVLVVVQFNKKDGRVVRRKYEIPFVRIETQLEQLYQQENFKILTHRIFIENNLSYISYNGSDVDSNLRENDPQKVEELREAYCQDLLEQTIKSRIMETPIGYLDFVKEGTLPPDNSVLWYDMLDTYNSTHPVYASYRRTLRKLMEAGVKPNE